MEYDKIIRRLKSDIRSGRFAWRRYLGTAVYRGVAVCTQPLFCSYGQIGYTV